jgi:radical SAM protein with 4Fe4S-binding SPASM domain
LEDVRRRLPIVEQLPRGKGRSLDAPVVGKAPRPGLAVWEFTLACDHGCLHCGPRAGRARPDELDTDEALRLVDDLAELGVGEVTLIGGEAYLRNDVLLVIRRIRERGMNAAMTTGGLNLTRARAEAMVEAGLESVSVSIDGLEANHDHVRARPGSWRAALAALQHVREAGARVACNSQFNRFNRFDHLRLLDILASEGVRAWQLQLTIPHGNAADFDVCLEPHMVLDVFSELEKIIPRAAKFGVRLWPANNLGYFGPLEEALRGSFRACGHYQGCTAGSGVIGIESDGAIKPCPTMGGEVTIGGNWREHGLRALWERAPEVTYVRQRTLDDLWGYCRDCYYAEPCMAGCTATSEPTLGRPGNNPFCHHRALEMDREGLRERIERVESSEPGPFGAGLFRLIREPKDSAKRERGEGITIVNPRTSRHVDPRGPGRELQGLREVEPVAASDPPRPAPPVP